MSFETHVFSPFYAAEQAYKVYAKLQVETLGLWARRSEAFLELPNRLANCHSLDDVLTEHVRFWQLAHRHYTQAFVVAVDKAARVASADIVEFIPAVRPRDYLDVGEPRGTMVPRPLAGATASDLRRSA